jgi:chloride channel protein, CIC family
LAIQDGMHLPGAELRQRHGQRPVGYVMREGKETLSSDLKVEAALARVQNSEFNAWPVIDERGVVGVLSLARLQRSKANGADNTDLKDLIHPRDFPHVHADHPLDLALERMGSARLDVLPVVSRANIHQMLGVVVLSDVLSSFGVDRTKWTDPAL